MVAGGFFVLAMVYAVLRYVVLGPVGWEQVPLYVTNKAVAVASLGLVGLAFVARRFSGEAGAKLAWVRRARRSLGMYGLALAGVHSIVSVLLLNPVYFDKFFNEAGSLTAMAGGSMLTGAVAMVLLAVMGRTRAGVDGGSVDSGRRHLRWLSAGVLGLTGLHVLLMGLPGWLTPGAWYGTLPPLTLISAVMAVAALSLGFSRRRG